MVVAEEEINMHPQHTQTHTHNTNSGSAEEQMQRVYGCRQCTHHLRPDDFPLCILVGLPTLPEEVDCCHSHMFIILIIVYSDVVDDIDGASHVRALLLSPAACSRTTRDASNQHPD